MAAEINLAHVKKAKSAYLPTLDGWRAVAILAVIFHHDAIHSLGPFNTRWLYDYGYAGVDVFFAISGILICSRLLDEERLDGFINLRRFYIRRLFRILPPSLFYLIVIFFLARFSVIYVSAREWLESIFFCRNYAGLFGHLPAQAGWYTGHFWSLALEEQFYFVFPPILVLSKKKYRLPILIFCAAIIALHRTISLFSRPWIHMQFHADVRLDALLVPAIFAVLASNLQRRESFKRALRFWPVLVVAALCVIPIAEGTAWHISLLVLLIPCIVLGSILNPDNFLGYALEWSWLRYIGRISYSLYLWQQLFFTQHFVAGAPLGLAQSWPLRLILTFACAVASYHLLERPLARLGHRWAPSATPGREDLDSKPTSDTPALLEVTRL